MRIATAVLGTVLLAAGIAITLPNLGRWKIATPGLTMIFIGEIMLAQTVKIS